MGKGGEGNERGEGRGSERGEGGGSEGVDGRGGEEGRQCVCVNHH